MIALLLVFTAFSLSSFVAILVGSDPYSTNTLVRVLFFITMLLSMVGVFSIFGILVARFRGASLEFDVVFRRAIFLSGLVVTLVLLESASLLNIVNSFSIFLLVVGFEMFITRKSQKSHGGF